MDLDPWATPNRQQITIFKKNGRRNFDKAEELFELCKEFGVSVTLVMPSDLTIIQQLLLLQNTSVLITPFGGMSFASLFLPKGSVGIYVDYFRTQYNLTEGLESWYIHLEL
jgi:hypothetical protein